LSIGRLGDLVRAFYLVFSDELYRRR